MLSLLSKNAAKEPLKPIATLIFSSAGKGKDLNIDTDGIPVYLDPDTTLNARRSYQHALNLSLPLATQLLTAKHKNRKQRRLDSALGVARVPRVFRNHADQQSAEQAVCNEIVLQEGHAFPLPLCKPWKDGEKRYREVLYASGSCDCGKSTFVAKYIRLWIAQRKKLSQPHRIILFSRVSADNAFRGLGIEQLKLDDELLAKPIDVASELADTMVVFDDIDSIVDKKMREFLWALRDDVMTVGSHSGIYCINTSHALTNWKSTRSSLKEAHLIVMFPYAERAKINEFLEKRVGLERHNRQFIVNEAAKSSRWVALSLRYPNYIIYESGVKLLLPSND